VLDGGRRHEQPTDLFRAENDGEAARLADRYADVGKIAALERDLGEEPQGSGTDVDGRYRVHPASLHAQYCARPLRESLSPKANTVDAGNMRPRLGGWKAHALAHQEPMSTCSASTHLSMQLAWVPPGKSAAERGCRRVARVGPAEAHLVHARLDRGSRVSTLPCFSNCHDIAWHPRAVSIDASSVAAANAASSAATRMQPQANADCRVRNAWCPVPGAG
jgi:hypothetical protein